MLNKYWQVKLKKKNFKIQMYLCGGKNTNKYLN